MASKQELLDIAKQAVAEGDEATANKIMDMIESNQFDDNVAAQPQENPKQEKPKEVGLFEAIGKGAKRGVEQIALGVTQRVMEYNQQRHSEQLAELEEKLKIGEVESTPENLKKLADLKNTVETETVALGLGSDFEQQQRENIAPIQEARPIATMAGNIVGQMAATPFPVAKGIGLAGQMVKGAAEGGAIGYAQATTEGESPVSNAGIGAALGGSVPLALKGVTTPVSAAYRALKGTAAPEAQKLVNYAAQNNIPLMTTDVIAPKTFAGRAIRDTAEKIPFAGTGGQRAEQQVARIGQIKKVADKFGEASDDEIYKSLIRKDNKIAKAAGDRYQRTIAAMGNTPVQLGGTISKIDAIISKQTAPGVIKNEGLVNALTKVKQELTSGQQTLETIRQNRTYFREAIKGEKTIINTTEQNAINSVYKSMTDDMVRSVEANLGPDAAAKMRQADAIWAREASEIKNTKLKNIFQKGDIKPELATNMLKSAEPSQLKILYGALDANGRKNARAAIIARAADAARESPEKFISAMEKLKPQTEIFFRGENKKVLDGAINYLKATQQAGKSAVVTPTGQAIIAPSALIGVAADVKTTGGMFTAGAASLGGAARVYESKPVRDLMLKLSSIPPGSTQFEKTVQAISDKISYASTRTQGGTE